jgi:hypothetical protein
MANLSEMSSLSPPNSRILPLVMCEGAGTRLWPASREGRPKQFIKFFGTRSTFQETLLRLSAPLFNGQSSSQTRLTDLWSLSSLLSAIRG